MGTQIVWLHFVKSEPITFGIGMSEMDLHSQEVCKPNDREQIRDYGSVWD